jgi:chitodextrinase
MIIHYRRNSQIVPYILSASLFLLALFPARLAASALTLAWDPNTEDDLGGYKVYYGTRSRDYDFIINVGNVTQYSVTSLEPETQYYFALTAYDTSGNESDFSEEVGSITNEEPPPEPPPDTPLEVVRVISPNGGEILTSGSIQTIAWQTNGSADLVDRVELLYTKNDRRAWKKIAILTGNSGSYDWTVPITRKRTRSRCRVMVVLKDGSGNIVGSDASDGNFAIQP